MIWLMKKCDENGFILVVCYVVYVNMIDVYYII